MKGKQEDPDDMVPSASVVEIDLKQDAQLAYIPLHGSICKVISLDDIESLSGVAYKSGSEVVECVFDSPVLIDSVQVSPRIEG